MAPSASATPQASFARDFHPETQSPYSTNTFSANTVLTPQCPQGIVGTPGSDPAAKVLNSALNAADGANFAVGADVHYTYNDNPTNASPNFSIQDCVMSYPAGFFSASDVNPQTGVLLVAASKKDLSSGTPLDGADLSGTHDSTDKIYFAWHVTGVTPGEWVCNFARDVNDQHGGSGNRKVDPTCFQVTGPDLAIAKTGPSSVNAGGNISYTVTATNTGTAPAANVEVKDTTPSGTTFVSETQASGPAATCTTPAVGATGLVDCAIPSLGPNHSASFTIVVQTSAEASNGTIITNTATVGADSVSPDEDDSASATTTVTNTRAPDLSIVKSGPDSVVAGSTMAYTLTATNTGTATADFVSVSDVIPGGTTFVSVTPSAGCTAPSPGGTGTVDCTIASLPAGGHASFTIVVTVGSGAADGSTITNTATVTADNVEQDSDDSSTVVTDVNAPDLEIAKTGPATVTAGGNLTYTVTATNTGHAAASDVVVTDTTPPGTTFVSVSPSAGCTAPSPGGTGTVTCTIATLAGGGQASFTIVVKSDSGAANGSTITNTASVGAENVTRDDDDTASVTTTVSNPPPPPACTNCTTPVPTTSTTSTTSTTVAPETTTTQVPTVIAPPVTTTIPTNVLPLTVTRPAQTLAFTGSDTRTLLLIAGALLAMGGLMLLAGTRRSTAGVR